MRRAIVKSVFNKELTDLLRNRRSLMVMFGVPLLLYPVLTISIASLSQSKLDSMTKRIATIAVVNSRAAPRLRQLLEMPENGTWALMVHEKADAIRLLKEGSVDAVIEAAG